MSAPRTLGQLRRMVADWRALAIRKARAADMAATWSFTYRPKDDPEDLKEISEAEFLGEPDSGHPRAGEYTAVAKDDTGAVLFDFSGDWLPDMGGLSHSDEPSVTESIAGMLAASAKVAKQTLEAAAQSEATANRRAAQADERAKQIRKELDDTIGAMDLLRKELHAANVQMQHAQQLQAEAEAQRDAALADMEEMKRSGAELAKPMDAVAKKLFRFFALQMGENPRQAIDADEGERALREAGEAIVRWLQDTAIEADTVEGPKVSVMTALYLHHVHGLPWKPLRIAFYFRWNVYLDEAPPPDWLPPADVPEGDGSGSGTKGGA